MPTALIISRHFPPLSSAGASIRVVKLIKYASQGGWQFIVLTQHPDYPVVAEAKLSAFLEPEIPNTTQVVRVRAPFASKPDPSGLPPRQRSSLLWGLRVLWQALTHGRRWEYDLVYAAAPVFVNAFIGAALSWLARKPLVLDLKDDWVGSPRYSKKPSVLQAIEQRLERLIIRRACRVLVVTPNSHSLYTRRYPQWKEKFALAPNGCDLDEYRFLQGRTRQVQGGKFTLLSAAWGYQGDYRDPRPLFHALALFFDRCPAARQETQVVFLGGSLSPEYDTLLHELGLESVIVRAGAVHREHLVERLFNSDLLFLVQPVENATAISGTLYEYWAVGYAPTLLIAEEGASSQLVEEYNLGQALRHSDLEGIAAYVERVYQAYKDSTPLRTSRAGIEAFDRKNIARQITDQFQACLENPSGSGETTPP